METTTDEIRPDLVGDGYDVEPLMDAAAVAEILGIPTKSVYGIAGLPRVRVSGRRIRWRPADVRDFIQRRTET